MDPLHIEPNDSVAIVESHGFMAAARLVQLISQETRVRVVAVTPMNSAGAITTVIAGALAEVQYALQIAKNGNSVSDSTFFAKPDLDTIEMLLRSAFGASSNVAPQRKPKQPEPLPLFESAPERSTPERSREESVRQPEPARLIQREEPRRQSVAVASNGSARPAMHANEDHDSKSLFELEKYPVHELRRYARSIPGFPIQGREISKANRSELLQLIKTTEERSRTQAAREAASGAPAHDELTSSNIIHN
jgi:microcompartment protein CcmL/EutN